MKVNARDGLFGAERHTGKRVLFYGAHAEEVTDHAAGMPRLARAGYYHAVNEARAYFRAVDPVPMHLVPQLMEDCR